MAEQATSRPRRLFTIFNFYEWARKKTFCEVPTNPRSLPDVSLLRTLDVYVGQVFTWQKSANFAKRYRNPLSIWLILGSSQSRALATRERRDDICSAADSALYQAPRCKHLITRKYAASFIVNWGWSICRRVSAPAIQDVLWRTIHLVTCHDRAKNGLASNYETQDLYMCEGTRGDTVARVLHGALTGVKSKWGVIASCRV